MNSKEKGVRNGSAHQDCRPKDVPEGKAIAVVIGGKSIAVFNWDGKFFAIDDTCTHAGGSLAEGELNGKIVTCPWHGATFDITTGRPLDDSIASESVGSYKVIVEGEDIKVEMP